MDATEIGAIIDGHYRLTQAIEKAIRADRNLVDENDRWLAHLLWGDDIEGLEVNAVNQTITGYAYVWTVQTGGSHEQVNFTIPLETLRKYL